MALIPPFFLNCVVAIGILNRNGSKNWIGSGFLYGKLILEENGQNPKKYRIFLVTNKHVLSNYKSIFLRFNPQDNTPAKDYLVDLVDDNNKLLWFGHSNSKTDIAIFKIDAKVLQKDAMKFDFFQSDQTVFTKDQLKEMQITEGDYIYVLGYPMGIVTCRQYVILRSGAISRIRDMFEGYSTDFIVDAFVFPGNSGGPVIIRPELSSIKGTKPNNCAGLIGIIKSYIPYRDKGISLQTGKPRILFEENTGLSIVEPVDYIKETIEEYEKLNNS